MGYASKLFCCSLSLLSLLVLFHFRPRHAPDFEVWLKLVIQPLRHQPLLTELVPLDPLARPLLGRPRCRPLKRPLVLIIPVALTVWPVRIVVNDLIPSATTTPWP